MLLGLIAVTVPILLHFLLRPRPKAVAFPALTLFRRQLLTGQRAHRVQDYRLLATRCALLAIAATLLAAPSCDPSAATGRPGGPRATVVILDDSWSTEYRAQDGRQLIESLRGAAEEFLRQVDPDAEPEAFAAGLAGPARALSEVTMDRAAARRALAAARADLPHARPLGDSLRAAVSALQTARPSRKRLIVLTDGAAHAWRDVPAKLLAGLDGLETRVLVPPHERRTNLSLAAASAAGLPPRDSNPFTIQVALAAAGLPARVSLAARADSREVARLDDFELPADAAIDVGIEIPPQPVGLFGLRLDLQPLDRLNYDQARYVALSVGRRPVAWVLVADRAEAADDLTALILTNLLAPTSLPESARPVELHELEAAELIRAAASQPSRPPELIVVRSGMRLSDECQRVVGRQLEAGATLLLVPRSSGAADWPALRPELTSKPPQLEALSAVSTIEWGESALGGAAPEVLGELSRAAVQRRLVFADLDDGVEVLARFGDGAPAIVAKPVGRGRLVALATSPDPAWSELGIRAAGLLEWLHQLMSTTPDSQSPTQQFEVGQSRRDRLAGTPARGIVSVRRVSPAEGSPISIRIGNDGPEPGWPTVEPGIYAVTPTGPPGPTAMYAVNWPAEESDLTPITAERLRELLGSASVTLESIDDAQAVRDSGAAANRAVDPKTALAALLIAALLIESLLSRGTRPAVKVEDEARPAPSTVDLH